MNRLVEPALILLILVMLGVLMIRPATATGKLRHRLPAYEYGTILMDNLAGEKRQAPVVFRHWVHRSKHTCRLCHVDVGFAMEAGQTLVTAEDNRQGRYCGACHNGRDSFACEEKTPAGDLVENCDRCHASTPVGMDSHIRKKFDKMAAALPEGRFGNGIDWAKASREGKLRPKDFIEGISFPRPKMVHQQGEVDLDARLAGLPDIIFSHKEHATWNSCDLCHPDLFAVKAGQTSFTMQDIFAGKFCGSCHGRVAFPVKDCGRCHTRPVG